MNHSSKTVVAVLDNADSNSTREYIESQLSSLSQNNYRVIRLYSPKFLQCITTFLSATRPTLVYFSPSTASLPLLIICTLLKIPTLKLELNPTPSNNNRTLSQLHSKLISKVVVPSEQIKWELINQNLYSLQQIVKIYPCFRQPQLSSISAADSGDTNQPSIKVLLDRHDVIKALSQGISAMLNYQVFLTTESSPGAELIDDHKTGFLLTVAEPNSTQQIIDKIKQDQNLLQKVAVAAHDKAVITFSCQRQHRRLIAVAKSLIPIK